MYPFRFILAVFSAVFLLSASIDAQNLSQSIGQNAVPTAEERVKPQQNISEIIIDVRNNGEVVVDQVVMNHAQLFNKLKRVASVHKNQAIRIRGGEKVKYQKIVDVISICQKAGIPNISFAIRPEKKR